LTVTLSDFADRHNGSDGSARALADGSTLTLLLGVPRSGTTWLGKIFDAHPRVIYRHEPDAVLPPTFPAHCPSEEIERYAGAVQHYIPQLVNVRRLKASGTVPIFPKPFQPFAASLVRRGIVVGARMVEAAMPSVAWPKRIEIPDFVRDDRAAIMYVVKSVSLIGATALLARVLPASRIIVIYRHPCGQLASVKRGISVKTMGVGTMFGAYLATTSRAREIGFTEEDYERLPLLEQWVYGWAFTHAKLFREVADLTNVRLVKYEDLCTMPMQQARALIEFSGLPWSGSVGRFIEESTRPARRQGYYSLYRDPMMSAEKWRQELTVGEVDRYMAIVDEVLPGLFPG
jgi:hypothetical protein